jgi:sugar phosphate isomerase/epimerase
MTANFVAREIGYHMTQGWMQGDSATQEAYRHIEMFGERFDGLLKEIKALGFEAIDLWVAHLHPSWAAPEQVTMARDLLRSFDLKAVSLAGGFGDTPEAFENTCRLAQMLDIKVLGGGAGLLHSDRAALIALLEKYDLVFGFENHPEKTPAEVLDKIGDAAGGRIGVAVDTGWFGTQGYDAAEALEELADRLVHVHLKDVKAAGGHETCRFGEGVVPIQRCVETLKRIGYSGAISIEHEPETFDPREDVQASLDLLRAWL